MIWPNDHVPPHVHIVRGGMVLAVIHMAYNGKAVSIRENLGLKRRELAQAVRVVAENNDLFIQEWLKIHGESEE